MALKNEFEVTGNWLFKYRSFLPLIIIPFLFYCILTPLEIYIQEILLYIGITISYMGECIRVFTRVYEVALVNESVSIDEENVLAHLRHHLNIENEDYEQVVDGLKKIITERYDDNVVGLMLNTLSDSVTLVGRLFDGVRTKNA